MSKLNQNQPYMTKEQFLETVCSEIKCRKAHKPLSDELLAHIDDQKNAYLDNGEDDLTAETKAVAEMGDPVDVGKQLNKIHRPRFDFGMFGLALLLIGIGRYLYIPVSDDDSSVLKFLFIILIGTGTFLFTYFFDYRILFKKILWLVCGLIAVNIFVMVFKIRTGNMNNVVFALHSSAPVLFIPIFAMFIHYVRNLSYLGIYLCGAVYFIFAFPMTVSSYSRFFLVTFTCLILLTISVSRNIFNVNRKKAYCIIYIPAIFVSALLTPYAIIRGFFSRIIDAFNPEASIQSGGWIYTMIRDIIAQSKSFGAADTALSMDFRSIRDFMLTYIFDKLGYIAGFAVITVFIVLIVRMLYVSFKQRTEMGFLLSFSATSVLSYKIIMAVMGNLGIYIEETYLPFLSYSGSDIIAGMALLGFIMSAYRNNNIIWETKSGEKPFRHLIKKI